MELGLLWMNLDEKEKDKMKTKPILGYKITTKNKFRAFNLT